MADAPQAAGGYVTYDAASDQFTLPPEQGLALAVEDSPCFIPGAFQVIASVLHDEPKIRAAFKSGNGVGWHEHHHDLFEGTERFFRPNYAANLVSSWIPSLEGVEAKLKAGARVADIGCGHGASTILMAQSYPNSTFFGFDYHGASIEAARQRAEAAGLGTRITFDTAPAKSYPGTGYDLVTFFDCLHDMGDPVGDCAARAAVAGGGWNVDDRGAVCGRPIGRQPQSDRPRFLRGVDDDLHAGLEGAGGRSGIGRRRRARRDCDR